MRVISHHRRLHYEIETSLKGGAGTQTWNDSMRKINYCKPDLLSIVRSGTQVVGYRLTRGVAGITQANVAHNPGRVFEGEFPARLTLDAPCAEVNP